MLFVTATRLEAEPIINALELKLVQKKPFFIYQNHNVQLIITGIGKTKAAAALGYMRPKTQIINIGIAAGAEVGKLFVIKKVIDKESGKVFHLNPPSNVAQATLTTFAKPLDKPYPTLVDMEGSAFVESARLFRQKIILFKVILSQYNSQGSPAP